MHSKRLMICSLLASAMLAPIAAQATLIVDFEITNPNQFVGATDDVTLLGRLTNNASSDETLDGLSVISFSYGSMSGVYGFSLGDIFALFPLAGLAPGDFYAFTFGTLTPFPAPVPDGTYTSGPLSIAYLNAAGQNQTARYDSVSVTVGRQAVPEPASLALLGIGMAGLSVMRRRRTV